MKYEVRSRLAMHPALQGVLERATRLAGGDRLALLTADTDLLVDGFQGSGNSVFCATFQAAQAEQGRAVELAGHCHSPAQIVKATRSGIPTLVLIRGPVDAVASLVSRWPYVGLAQGLRSYSRFYTSVEPARAGYLVATFDDAVQRTGEVVSGVNRRFGTAFAVPDPPEPPPRLPGRDERRDLAREEISSSERLAPLRSAAESVYERFLTFAAAAPRPT